MAHALKELPEIREAFRQGRVSYSKVRAKTRVVTPENEGYLMIIARHGTASHVERVVRHLSGSCQYGYLPLVRRANGLPVGG